MTWTDKAACKGMEKVFFANTPTGEVERWKLLAKQREFCVDCPVFDACLKYSMDNYEDTQFLTLAGLDEYQRAEIHSGKRAYVDWRIAYRENREKVLA
jgi:hypothetical protein